MQNNRSQNSNDGRSSTSIHPLGTVGRRNKRKLDANSERLRRWDSNQTTVFGKVEYERLMAQLCIALRVNGDGLRASRVCDPLAVPFPDAFFCFLTPLPPCPTVHTSGLIQSVTRRRRLQTRNSDKIKKKKKSNKKGQRDKKRERETLSAI